MAIRAFRGSFKGGQPAVRRGGSRRVSRVGRPPPNVTRIRNVANHTQRMKMGVNYRVRATSNAVAGHVQNHGLGYTTAPKVRGSR